MFEYFIENLPSYIIIIAIIIVFVIATFLLVIFMPKPRCYFDTDLYGELLAFEDEKQFITVQEEVIKYMSGVKNDENTQHVEGAQPIKGNETKIRSIYNCDAVGSAVESHLIPNLYELLRSVPDVKSAMLVELDKKTNMRKEKGSAHTANNTIRCVLPIKVSGAKKSGIWVDGEIKIYTEGRWVIYDNSREHSMYNKHKRLPCCLLIVDIERPASIPTGIAVENNDSIL